MHMSLRQMDLESLFDPDMLSLFLDQLLLDLEPYSLDSDSLSLDPDPL